jgi:hypothetical protein
MLTHVNAEHRLHDSTVRSALTTLPGGRVQLPRAQAQDGMRDRFLSWQTMITSHFGGALERSATRKGARNMRTGALTSLDS